MRRLAAALVACLLPVLALAQDRPNTILVLDGSGSMWGQIDGINKIVIAREVVGTLLDDFPEDQNLGLTVYGHRTRGDCTDIETVVAPGAGTLGAIRDAVNGINPRGRTPMTDAVIAAAEALRFTEEKATVILVSDGIETCNPDPCAAARALEQAGVDFTAHVIGFDVTDPEALAQMQCLADETGGTFRSASNAAELTDALTTVAVEPEPVPQSVRVMAVLQPGGPEIEAAIDWKVRLGGDASEDGTGPGFALDLMAGAYDVRGIRTEDGAEASAGFTVPRVTEAGEMVVEVVFPEPEPDPVTVTFEARIGDETGDLIADPVIWTLTHSGASDEATGNPVANDLVPGSYEVTAYWTAQETEQSRQFIATDDPRTVVLVFEAPLPSATVTAPASAVAGSTIEVGWTGPAGDLDYIGIGPVGAEGADVAQNFSYTRDGSPLSLLVPIGEGQYEVRYILQDGRQVLASAPIEVTPVTATVTAPDTAIAGSTIEVAWDGPDYRNDYVGIGIEGATGADLWENFTYTREGSPLDLLVPTEPGAYVIAYFTDQDRVNIGQTRISVTEVQATVTAPAEAVAGSTIEVGWTGPDNRNDYIGIGRANAESADRWENFTRTSDGSPLTLLVPTEPGDYLIRYFLDQDRVSIAEAALTVTAATATITAPAEAVAGSTIEIGWTGPDYRNDYIGIGRSDAESADRWENFTRTSDGSPLRLLVPTEPGDYQIRYFMDQDRTPLAEAAITVLPVGATISAPAEAVAGSTIEVGWTGPDNRNDYIGIGRADAESADRWENFTRTSDGSPLSLVVPTSPGDYLIRYFLDQDRVSIAEAAITVTPVTTSLSAPAEAVAGSTIEVGWTGPDYRNDYIGIGAADADGSDRWENFTRTSDGSPLRLLVPTTPGDYLIRYILDQDRVSIGEVALTVTPVTATLTAPATAAAGSTIEVGWTGPNYRNDLIAIGPAGAERSDRWEEFTYAEKGNPAMVKVPEAPGDYAIRYILDQDRVTIAEVPLTVE